MIWEQMLILGLCTILMLTGVFGSLIPALPSTPLVFLGALGHWFYYQEQSISLTVLAVLFVMMILSLGLDFVASVVGAKKLGATWKGILGVVIGGLTGLFFGLPGIIIGPFVGAMLFEMLGGTHLQAAAKAGFGALIGLLAGALGRFAFAIAMTGLFFINLFLRRMTEDPAIELVLSMNIWA
jgi:uncharacterized protein